MRKIFGMRPILKSRRGIAALFLLLFVAYYSNVTLFEHTHIINGVTIVHSHFHADSHHNSRSGGHTANNVTLISQLNNFQTTGSGIQLFSFGISDYTLLIVSHADDFAIVQQNGFNYSLRAPPVSHLS